MIDKLVNIFVNKQINSGRIQSKDFSVYAYGYILILETIVIIMIEVMIGLLFDELYTVLLFALFFIPLRSYCGGWHAKKAGICIILSNFTVMTVVVAVKLQWVNWSSLELVIGELICFGIIFCLSPVESKNKKLCEKEKKKYRKKAHLILEVHFVVFILFVLKNIRIMIEVIILVHIIQGIALILERIRYIIPKIRKSKKVASQ